MVTPQDYQIDITKRFLSVDKILYDHYVSGHDIDLETMKKFIVDPAVNTTSKDGVFVRKIRFSYKDIFNKNPYKVELLFVTEGKSSLTRVYLTCKKARLTHESLSVVVENSMPIVKTKNNLVHINYRVFWFIQKLIIDHWSEFNVKNEI